MRLLWSTSLAVLACSMSSGCHSNDGVAEPDTAAADASVADAQPPGQCDLQPTGRVTLPADESPHQEVLEWWYWTGHLQAQDGRWFGFEQTFFLRAVGATQGQMVHHAITDVAGDNFAYDEVLTFTAPAPVDSGFNFAVGPHTASGSDGHDLLHGEVDDYVLDVELTAVKPPVFQDGDGYTDYSFGGYTYYYSRERMEATGTIQVGDETLTVTGTAWFDHQWGDLSSVVDTGWDWFAIQLDDNREIMVFLAHADGETVLVGGSYTDENCQVTSLAADAFELTTHSEWTSPHTGCTYPQDWTLTIPGLELTVTPVMQDQELDTSIIDYWEGMAEVSGDATGRAYIELNGYCNGN